MVHVAEDVASAVSADEDTFSSTHPQRLHGDKQDKIMSIVNNLFAVKTAAFAAVNQEYSTDERGCNLGIPSLKNANVPRCGCFREGMHW